MVTHIIFVIDQTVPRISKQWIPLIIGIIRFTACHKICPWRHCNDSTWKLYPIIFQIMAQRHRKPSACGISCYNDILCKPALVEQPLICTHCIFQCRRIWIFRCHTVIDGEHTHPFADFIVKSRKHAVCVPHRSDIPTAMKL